MSLSIFSALSRGASRRTVVLPASTSLFRLKHHKSAPSPPPKDEDDSDEPKRPTKRTGNPRNEEILRNFVVARLIDPETGTTGPPVRVADVLARLTRKTHYLELVARKPEPIVKIVSSRELYIRAKEKHAQRQASRAPEEKEVQLTWAIASGDMHIKLKKAREDLAEGHRCNIVFAPRKGSRQPPPPPEDQARVIDDTLRFLADVGRECRARDTSKRAVVLFVESLRPRKLEVDLEWDGESGDGWAGLDKVVSALRKGGRVDAVFLTPPPPKNTTDEEQAVETAPLKQCIEETVAQLQPLGIEWRKRDVRKAATVVYLEPPPKP